MTETNGQGDDRRQYRGRKSSFDFEIIKAIITGLAILLLVGALIFTLYVALKALPVMANETVRTLISLWRHLHSGRPAEVIAKIGALSIMVILIIKGVKQYLKKNDK